MKTKNIIRVFTVAGLILLVPLLAMLFTDEVQWNVFDFVVIGSLLVGAGLVFEFTNSVLKFRHRWLVGGTILVVVMLVWAELAVGVFGSPIAGS